MKKLFWMGLCMLVGFSAFAKDAVFDIERSLASDGVVDNLFELEALFVGHQAKYLPISPPSLDVFVQDYDLVVPMRAGNLPERFVEGLVGKRSKDGFATFEITVYEDLFTRETVFLNVDGLELARLAPRVGYDPLAWQRDWFGLGTRQTLDPWTAWIFDPAHIAAGFLLVNDKDYEAYVLVEEQRRREEAVAWATLMRTMGGRDGEGTNMVVGFSADTNGIVSLTLTPPIGFGPFAEVFQKQSLVYPLLWDVAENKLAVTTGVETVWCSSSSNSTMFFIVGDTTAGFDDGDGYSELRERHVEDSNPLVFDMRDTDGDTMHDWFEVMYFGDLSQMGWGDYDGDGLQNAIEMVLEGTTNVVIVSDPTQFDTDGDGTDDGTEVGQGSDPLDPADGGQPPATNATTAVTLYIHNKSVFSQAEITITLSDDANSYEVISSGTALTSNTFTVAKGRSYTLSLEQDPIVPLVAGTEGYFADVSGTGVVTKDPLNILGDHNTNLSQGVNTAAVHVVTLGFTNVWARNLQHGDDQYEDYKKCIAVEHFNWPSELNLTNYLSIAPVSLGYNDLADKISFEIETEIFGDAEIKNDTVLDFGSSDPDDVNIYAFSIKLLFTTSVVDRLVFIVYSDETQPEYTGWLSSASFGNDSGNTWLNELPRVYSQLGTGNSDPEPSSCNPQSWGWDPGLPAYYHFDAEFEIRSESTQNRHGHQACYDAAGILITGSGSLESLASAGTADFAHPSNWYAPLHSTADVRPFIRAAQLDGNPVDGVFNLSHPLIRIGPNLIKYYQRRPAHAGSSVSANACCNPAACTIH